MNTTHTSQLPPTNLPTATADGGRPPQAPALQPAPAPLPPHEYQQRIALERPKAWRGIVALLLLLIGTFAFSLVFGMIAFLVDMAVRGTMAPPPTGLSPIMLAGGMLGLAALTPWSMLLQKWFFGVPMASLHSVFGRFRWDVFGRTIAIIVPLWAVTQAVYPWLMPMQTVDYRMADVMAFLVIALTLVPLQSMGEEYAFRGLAFRIAASWGRGPRVGLILGIVVSSLLFMVAHAALDPWLNLYYFVFGAALAVITWRTGGIEAAIVLHVVNNALAFIIGVATRSDLAASFDRSVGAASPVMLLPCAVLTIIAAVVWWRTRTPANSLPAAERPLAE